MNQHILVDCDTGLDDALALLYLTARADVEIVAAGSVHGNATAPVTADNTLQVLELAGAGEVPVAVGAHRPLIQPLSTGEIVHGSDGLGGRAQTPVGTPVAGSAAERIVSYARARPGQLTVLAIGPLTNLALATMLEPMLPRLLGRVVVMGGAVMAPGNITATADANSFHDPEAAEIVFSAGYSLTLVPLDVTATVAVDASWIEALAAVPGPRPRFAAGLLEHYAKVYFRNGFDRAWLHDPLAAVLACEPELGTYRSGQVAVELEGRHTRGMTVLDQRPAGLVSPVDERAPVAVTTGVESNAVLDRLSDSLRAAVP